MDSKESILDAAVRLIGELDRERERLLSHYADLRQAAMPQRHRYKADVKSVEEISSRVSYLRNIILKQINLARDAPSKKVFLSYSKSGEAIASALKKSISTRFKGLYNVRDKVCVTTGFDRNYHPSKINEIVAEIAAAESFIGVWSAEEIRDERKILRKVPSPWMPVELGMALSFYKPVILIVDEEIFRPLVLKINADTPHEILPFGKLVKAGGKLTKMGVALVDRVIESALFRMHVGSTVEDYVYYDFFRN